MKRILALALLAGIAPIHAQDPNQATPVSSIKIKEGFKVELLYSVPKDQQGSWVSMTVDNKGRLIVSDQYGSLYRVTPSAIGGPESDTKIEKINAKIGHAQGILWNEGAIYLTINDGAEEFQGRGLYKVTASKGDDDFDTVVQLRAFPNQGGEHGPHGVVLGPDKKSIYTIVGNQTPMTPMDTSRVPLHWSEDQLFPMLLGRGFMRDVLAPGAWTAKTDFEGKKWELLATGCRNTYDASFNHEGDLFTFDADMEWDTNTPWYRPIRVCFMQSGGEFGWRTCSKKFPVRWEDSLPPVIDVGLGSPTGVAYGYGAAFPAKYAESLFICDWSYGKLYAVHVKAKGAAYTADLEEFMSASPLPLTDLVVSPTDKALYVTVGGRKTQSGLYRVTYTGKESTESAPTKMDGETAKLHELRRSLEVFHGKQDPKALEVAWPQLGHSDRNIRFAARIAIEHQPVATWQDKALKETNPRAALTALMALARSVGEYEVANIDDGKNKQGPLQLSVTQKPQADKTVQAKILEALNKIDLNSLKGIDKVTLIRDYELAFTRLGEPDAATKQALAKHLSPLFPQVDPGLNRDLCELLVYLGDDSVTAKAAPYVNN
ncbi:MAG: putative heme-binding protein, partial [Verrucomicrobiaceae bacterium]|nr:putative heme-binding protein [Verrucomicrobiaceae bacterium]